MLNKITKKERAVQKALGLISWYNVKAETNGHEWWRNVKAVSKDDAIHQFIEIWIKTRYTEDIRQTGNFEARKLPWTRDL